MRHRMSTDRSSALPSIDPPAGPRLPGRADAWWFEFRACGLRGLRWISDLVDPAHRRHRPASRWRDAPVICESTSRLWPRDGATEHALVLGKIQNLRRARIAFDGIELLRGQTLSFWAQVGRPTRRRGFAIGRELREGCLIPSFGGGLCQLSNVLYDAAIDAGIEVLERHAHSQVVPGSAASRDRDATVFWNYIDLRLRAKYDFRLEVDLDDEHLHVRVRSPDAAAPGAARRIRARPEIMLVDADGAVVQGAGAKRPGDCVTCGQDECFRNAPAVAEVARLDEATTKGLAVLVDSPTLEHVAFLRGMPGIEWLASPRQSLLRRAVSAIDRRLRPRPPAWRAMNDARIAARRVAAYLRPGHHELYVDQSWLPFLWRDGVLAGRRFHVLMRTLPMERIHAELDVASTRWPDEPTLRDFRADDALLRDERLALASASSWIGAHAGMLAIADARAHPLAWCLPPSDAARASRDDGPFRVLFPASSLVRKGVRELAQALHGLDVEVILPVRDGGEAGRWGNLPITRIADPAEALSRCDVVALPAWVEHQPRALLAAIARGIPVIATPACGLGALHGWMDVPAGDVDALRRALLHIYGLCCAKSA